MRHSLGAVTHHLAARRHKGCLTGASGEGFDHQCVIPVVVTGVESEIDRGLIELCPWQQFSVFSPDCARTIVVRSIFSRSLCDS